MAMPSALNDRGLPCGSFRICQLDPLFEPSMMKVPPAPGVPYTWTDLSASATASSACPMSPFAKPVQRVRRTPRVRYSDELARVAIHALRALGLLPLRAGDCGLPACLVPFAAALRAAALGQVPMVEPQRLEA